MVARSNLRIVSLLPSLTAVQNNTVYILDGHNYFNRPGPRLADSAEILAETLHPDEFEFRFEDTGWIRWR